MSLWDSDSDEEGGLSLFDDSDSDEDTHPTTNKYPNRPRKRKTTPRIGGIEFDSFSYQDSNEGGNDISPSLFDSDYDDSDFEVDSYGERSNPPPTEGDNYNDIDLFGEEDSDGSGIHLFGPDDDSDDIFIATAPPSSLSKKES